MENRNDTHWFLMGLLKLCLVGWAAVMFSKTSEVLTALAPVTIFGQQGLEVLYGVGTAVLIEGVAVLLALLPVTHTNRNATVYAGILFLISSFCQFLDHSLVKEAANQTTTEVFMAWIALGIPSVGFGGLLLLLWTLTKDPSSARMRPPTVWIGIVPWFRSVLYGSDAPKKESTVITEEEPVDEEAVKGNGKPKTKKVEEPVNPK